MKCFKLGIKKENEPTKWVEESFNSFFQSVLTPSETQIDKLYDEVADNTCHFIQWKTYYLFGQKCQGTLCLFICDLELSTKQMYYLCDYLVNKGISAQTVFNDFEKYTQCREIGQVKENLSGLKAQLIEDVDKLVARGERLKELEQESENLYFEAVRYKRTTEELNSCWPTICPFM